MVGDPPVGSLGFGSAPPGSVNVATATPESGVHATAKTGTPPVATTAGSDTVAVLVSWCSARPRGR